MSAEDQKEVEKIGNSQKRLERFNEPKYFC
jgi:hypothetical protein